jgi:transposase, IS30 family
MNNGFNRFFGRTSLMGHHYRHLDMDERRQIMRLLERKASISEIAQLLGRHSSTLYRELRRNFFRDQYPEFSGWSPWTANQFARKRRHRHRKLERDRTLRCHVISKLEQHWSPEQIAGRLRFEGAGSVCSETIYRFVYDRANRNMELYTLLAKARHKRRRRGGRRPRGSHIPLYCNIKQRPPEIGGRETFGHWEADLVIFRREFGQANVTSLVERKTCFQIVIRNKDRGSVGVLSAIEDQLRPLPEPGRRTITFDRGSEFLAWRRLYKNAGIKSYFCDVASPYQKGSVENSNGRLRRYLPLETDLQAVDDATLSGIALRMNNTPRRCLGYRTPLEVFQQELEQFRASC